MRLLIIEDNERLAGLIANGLDRQGYSCDRATALAEADDCFASADYDAIILDLGMPDGDGLKWLASARRNGRMVPALILTARGALGDRIAGLDAGADDYLVKPAEIDEIAARLRALLRRPGNRAPTVMTSGAIAFDTASRSATIKGASLELSRREADLLELLMRREGSVIQRGVIEEALYSFNDPVTPNAIEAVISRLRRKLEENGQVGRLHTVRGVGYMLAVASA
ncbi:response regulator [Aquisediminimonas profunda]|uniref:response regulator n=1 Tax=Aquisediminimonas profunda TaxID=1550733 RepID=UPI001C6309E1|nr:response regulator transcription factor [Aquisediminimonas profunda]